MGSGCIDDIYQFYTTIRYYVRGVCHDDVTCTYYESIYSFVLEVDLMLTCNMF